MHLSLPLKATLSLLGFSTTSFGGIYLYNHSLPKTIKELLVKEGYKLATTDNEYKAIFIDSKSDITSTITTIQSNDKATQAHSKIKTWCETELAKPASETSTKSQVIKYCTDNPKTANSYLVKLGKDFEEVQEDDYKVTYTLYKGDSKFPSSEVSEENKLKTWCEGELKKPWSQAQLDKVSWFCKKPEYSTVQEKLQKENSSWSKEDNDDKYKEKFNTWKHTTEFLKLVKSSTKPEEDISDTTDENTAKTKVKTWCDNGLNKKLSDDGVWENEYKYLKAVCKKEPETK